MLTDLFIFLQTKARFHHKKAVWSAVLKLEHKSCSQLSFLCVYVLNISCVMID